MITKAFKVSLALSTLAFASSMGYASVNSSDRIAELKSQIIAISAANTTRVDNFGEVRAELQPLVDELASLAPARSEADKKVQVVGAWKNLWTDMYFGPTVDLTETYQVVDANGFYYNLSRNIAGKAVFTDYLRGSFTDQGDYLAILFTRDFTVQGWLSPGSDLVSVAAQAESGEINGTDTPNSRAVGVIGKLQNSFVDDELRIVTGTTDGLSGDNIFILTRATTN